MSLSRFYKKNPDFQPDSVLDKSMGSSGLPVWDEPAIHEEAVVPEDIPESERNESSAEEIHGETMEEETELPPPPPPPPAEPEIDIDAIREEAFASGLDMGRLQAEEDFENGANTLLCICNELDKLRETILQNSAREMKELVMDISEKVIRHSVAEQNETIVATIQDAIQLAVKSDEFQIQIHPDDLECLQQQKQEIVESINGLENIVFQPDATIERGGCQLESPHCTVDATLTSQIKVIKENVMADDPMLKGEPTP